MGILSPENIKRDGGMMNIFRSVGCIGDSLSSGEFEFDSNGETGYWDCYEYSWGKQIERVTGIEITNFSRGGLTAYQIYKEADEKSGPTENITQLFDSGSMKQCYIIALGVNDMNCLHETYPGGIGNAEQDVVLEDYTKNAQTFIGKYAQIIQRLQSIQPDTKFFIMTMPSDHFDHHKNYEEVAKELRCLAKKLGNCYVIDLFRHAPKYDEEFRKKYYCGGHMNAMGYVLTAHFVMTYIDHIIQSNMQDFKYVQFIGSDKKPVLK